jgi:excisionase family DNA binding protein
LSFLCLFVSLFQNTMLRVTYPNGTVVEATDPASQKQLTEAVKLSTTYTVKTLATRLEISERSAYDLLRGGLIRYFCCGAKNYRVSEQAVREFQGDVKAVA